MSTWYFHHIHPPSPFLIFFPLPLAPTPQTGAVLLSCSLFLEKDTFYLYKIAI
jgi:hypothetical protein